jgi:integrase
MAKKIYKAADIKTLAAPAKGNIRHPIDGHPGLFLCITKNDARSWQYRYYPKTGPKAGSERLFTIGEFPLFPLSLAKDEWKQLRRRVQLGDDPLQDIEDVRKAPTIRTLGDRYLEEHAIPHKRTGERDRRRIAAYINPRMGSMKVAAVIYDDCYDLHRSLTHKPIEANRVRSLLVTMFDHSIRWGWRQDNPARLVKPNTEYPRERFLSQAEIVTLSDVLAKWPDRTVADCVRLILLTGCRRGEAMKMTWDQLQFSDDGSDGVWLKSPTSTKQKKAHRVPLSAPALKIIANQTRTSKYVFAGKHGGICNVKNQWIKIREKAELRDLRLHDLRHSFASILASSGQSLLIIGQLLGHSQPSSTKRYSHFYDQPLREATERVAAVVTSASKPKAKMYKIRS